MWSELWQLMKGAYDMKFGSDFFKTLEFIVTVLRLFARVFGDDDDRQADDEQRHKHGDYGEKLYSNRVTYVNDSQSKAASLSGSRVSAG